MSKEILYSEEEIIGNVENIDALVEDYEYHCNYSHKDACHSAGQCIEEDHFFKD